MSDIKGLCPAKFEAIRDLYWVSSGKDDDEMSWFGWRFGAHQPPPVPNPTMRWRHPTYRECARRQQIYERSPENFIEITEKYGR